MNKYLLIPVLFVFFSCGGPTSSEKEADIIPEPDAWGDPTIATLKHDVVNPYFSMKSGLYNAQIEVAIQTPYQNVQTYYTIDGSEPTKSSMLYTDAISLKDGDSFSIKAISFFEGKSSNISEAYYRVDNTYEPDSYDSDLSLEEYSEGLEGTWKGYVETPWHGIVSAQLTITEDGIYTPESLTRYFYQANDQEYMNFYVESEETVLYYGSDGPHSGKKLELTDLYPDGKATGDIHLIWPNASASIIESIDRFAFKHNKQVMEFNFTRSGACCSVLVELTKVE